MSNPCPVDNALTRPRIVCLCGSTRFKPAFVEANEKETLAGHIVLSVGAFGHADNRYFSDNQKAALDTLHKRKIDLADEVLVINVGDYIGDSTRSEVAYAEQCGKPVRWLESRTQSEPGPYRQCVDCGADVDEGEPHECAPRAQPEPAKLDQAFTEEPRHTVGDLLPASTKLCARIIELREALQELETALADCYGPPFGLGRIDKARKAALRQLAEEAGDG